jgi:hypothetical protein
MFRAFTTDIAIKYYATNQSNSQNAEALGVELRGFEPLTPCMPSRDPRHGAHDKASRSRPLHQCIAAGAWWLLWACTATLLRACCAEG